MPIRFRCNQCNQLLGIASRKAGSEIACPKCGTMLVVPKPEPQLPASQAGSSFGGSHPASEDTPSEESIAWMMMSPPGESPEWAPAGTAPGVAAPPGLSDALPPLAAFPSPPNAPGPTWPGAMDYPSSALPAPILRAPPPPALGPSSMGTSSVPSPMAASGVLSGMLPASSPAMMPSSLPAPPAASAAPVAAGPAIPSDMILFPRRAFYIQALLFVIVAVVAFGSGYLIGRGDAKYSSGLQERAKSRQSAMIEGKISYNSGVAAVGDKDAVVALLPVQNPPQGPIPSDGLRPRILPGEQSHAAQAAIETLGGGYGRAAEDGRFWFNAPDQGKYHLLIISHGTKRPSERIEDEADLAEIAKYFGEPRRLIDRQKYVWKVVEVQGPSKWIEHDFGLDGQ